MSATLTSTRRRSAGLDRAMVRRAGGDALRKLHPRRLAANPVMFVVAVGSLLTTGLLVRDACTGASARLLLFEGQVTLWLWFTVLFANFAEAMAEGRGKEIGRASCRERV